MMTHGSGLRPVRKRLVRALSRVVESLERTALYSVDIAEIAVNLAEKG